VVLSRHFTFSLLQQRNGPTQYSKNIAYSRAKIKKNVCFPHPTDRYKTLRLKIFVGVICDDFIFLVTGSSDIVPEFTLGTGLHI
jgi:hypothetical protein